MPESIALRAMGNPTANTTIVVPSKISKIKSRSLSELTRRIDPRTYNGPCTTTEGIVKTHLGCNSLPSLALVSFPALSQIKPQNPLLVFSSVNSFKFHSCNHTPPRI